MKITKEYIEQNKELHKTRDDYGSNGHKWAQVVIDICKNLDTRDVLDYGCGKGTLRQKVPLLQIKNYDPAVEEWSQRPEKADVVCCFDVLEHVEPKCLDDVLRDLSSLAKRAAIFVIATRPAVKFLPDGRNAHLIQKGMLWWLQRVMAKTKFQVQQINNMDDQEFLVILKNKNDLAIKEKMPV